MYREHVLLYNIYNFFCWFIPVCTGNTVSVLLTSGWITVYPCVYREHWVSVILQQELYGLSLCVQGTRHLLKIKRLIWRFIPVCTGNTRRTIFTEFSCAVYPCVYREHDIGIVTGRAKTGLSLCVQGTLYLLRNVDNRFRFIPVCTGNTPVELV